jgi:hypothetical protein
MKFNYFNFLNKYLKYFSPQIINNERTIVIKHFLLDFIKNNIKIVTLITI